MYQKILLIIEQNKGVKAGLLTLEETERTPYAINFLLIKCKYPGTLNYI
jgi:hypothetical protein